MQQSVFSQLFSCRSLQKDAACATEKFEAVRGKKSLELQRNFSISLLSRSFFLSRFSGVLVEINKIVGEVKVKCLYKLIVASFPPSSSSSS